MSAQYKKKIQKMKELIIQEIQVLQNFGFLLIKILITKIMHAMGVIIY